jgi:hypothetical protein
MTAPTAIIRCKQRLCWLFSDSIYTPIYTALVDRRARRLLSDAMSNLPYQIRVVRDVSDGSLLVTCPALPLVSTFAEHAAEIEAWRNRAAISAARPYWPHAAAISMP